MSYQLAPEQPRDASSSPPTQQREYAEGLEVGSPPYGLEPVTVPQGLEVALSTDPEWSGREADTAWDKSMKIVRGGHDNGGDGSHDASKRPWWKRRRFLVGIAAAMVVAIALGAGLGVGLGSTKAAEGDSESKDDGGDEPVADICGGGTCPLVLSTSLHGPGLYVFGLTSSGGIAYRVRNIDSHWEDWVSLGQSTVSFISQPRAINWGVRENGQSLFTRLDVFAIGSDRAVYNRWRSGAEDWEDNEWLDVGSNAGSVMSICSPLEESLNLWGTAQDTDHITHSWWVQKNKDDISDEGQNGITRDQGQYNHTDGGQWRAELGYASSALHCISRHYAKAAYDVAYYANNSKQATVASWNGGQRKWDYQSLEDGNWVGDPYLFNPDDGDRWDFFGVQSNKEVYHQSWTPDSFPPMDRLGGSVISQPTVVRLGSGTYDLVALGSDGMLQHLYFDGNRWEENWEDLGIEARSAPTARSHNDQVVVLAIAQNGSLIAWTRDARRERSWKGSFKAENLAGNLSLGFLGDSSSS